MMQALSLAQIAKITAGHWQGVDALIHNISTDSRTLQQGDLFVALKGLQFNGNQFVDIAAKQGAAAAVISEPVATTLPTVTVADTRIALGLLGKHNRLQSKAPVIALTGSQGKTTVKEMTAQILQQAGAVLSTQGNLNNDFGVPLTLLRLQPEHQFAVIEMGANAAGEIAYTTALTQPDIAHITCVAPTHVEGFGSLAGVASAKAEIWQGLRAGGTAVVNVDDLNVVLNLPKTAGFRVVGVSGSGDSNADYVVKYYQERGLQGSSFELRTPQGTVQIALALPGKHNASNAVAAAALAMEAGASLAQVQAGLAATHSVKGRLVVRAGRNGGVLLDDTYNASPASFKAAIDVLATRPGLRIVVAGDMGELGSFATAGHREVGAYAKAKGIEQFWATGTLMRDALAAFGSVANHAVDCANLAQRVLPFLSRETTVLIKGSRSAGMERVVQLLLAQDGVAKTVASATRIEG